jgi:hypothetical protein
MFWMNIDLTPIFQALMGMLATIITVKIIPYIKSNVDKIKFAELEKWVIVAVKAAEQYYKGAGRGREKMGYVLDFLSNKGFNVEDDFVYNELSALIEKSVYEIKN